MYSLYSILSISHNSDTNHMTWLATNGASLTPFRAVGTVKDCPPDRAVLHAVCGALDSLAKQYSVHIVPGANTPIQMLVPNNKVADRLNSLDSAPLLGAERAALGIIAAYKKKAAITFFSSIEDVPVNSLLATVFKGWSLGWK